MKKFFISIKDSFINVFKKDSKEENLFKLDGRVPLKKAIPFGIQHILAMFFANVTPILIVFGAIGIYGTNLATKALIGALFMAGIGTLIQLFIGARLPIVVGTSFTFASICITIGLSKGGGEIGYYTILGSTLVGGIISLILCFFINYWRKLIKPIVPCVVIFGIGLSLLKSGATQFLGGDNVLSNLANGNEPPVPYYFYLIVSLSVLICAILWQVIAKGIWKNLNIAFGIVIGYIICLFIPNMLDFSNMQIQSINDVISLPSFINLSKLNFEITPIILVTICFLISILEGIGNTTALCQEGLNRFPTNREIRGALMSDAFSSSLSSIFGTLPLTTFAQNVSIVAQTKVINKFTIFIGALILIFTSFFPIAANFLFTIPDAVLGGAMVILFGSIVTVGMKLCAQAGFNNKNILIISISTCLGFGITLCDGLFTYLHSINLDYIADLLSNNILNMFIISLILSFIIPEEKQTKDI